MMRHEGKDLVYVCSPLGAETPDGIMKNMKKARLYMGTISEKYNCRAIAPHAILPVFLDDRVPEERALGLKFGLDLLKICKKVVVCGMVISEGMQKEIEFAQKLGIPVIYNDMPKPSRIKITIEIEGD